MDPIPYTHFWSEEPETQRRAWRPTDEVRRRLMRLWIIQALLLAAIVLVAGVLTRESKRVPPIYAKLPNGVIFETTTGDLQMDRLARTELVNNVLQILYYQEGSFNYLETVRQNVKPQLLGRFRAEMQNASKQTNSTVYLNVVETFEALNVPAKGFDAVTKGVLSKRSNQESASAPIYIRTRWLLAGDRYLLSRVEEIRPGDYYELFLAEKERLKKLSKPELERELGVRKNQEIPLPNRNHLF
jgi:hypothetical protein